jgi:AcrR family transcriptional regulator
MLIGVRRTVWVMALRTPAPPLRPVTRRTQEERRAQTRARLLQATADCLAELGWAGTTTTEVARRAGVSRGAQQHHYRTKTELVAAAIEHLLQRQRAEFERAFTQLPPGDRNVDGAIELLWKIYQGPVFAAVLELVMAARTDSELRPICASINEQVFELTVGTFGRIFPSSAANPAMPAALRGMLAMFAGLALARGLDGDPQNHCGHVLDHAKVLGRLLVPEQPETSAGPRPG